MDYAAIKKQLSMKEVVNRYGELCDGDMCLCPFHTDSRPSMKVYPDHGYCFSCNTYADLIGYVSGRLNISNQEAAALLVKEFNLKIPLDDVAHRTPTVKPPKVYDSNELKVLVYEYLKKAKFAFECLKDRYAPMYPDSEEGCNSDFVIAVTTLPKIEYYLDFFYTGRYTPDETDQMVNFLINSGEMSKIRQQITPFYENPLIKQYFHELYKTITR